MKSKAPWFVALAATILMLFFANRACNTLPAKLRDAELKYEAYRVVSTEAQKQSDAKIAALLAANTAIAAENTTLTAKVDTQKATIKEQAKVIAGLQANEPPTTPEIEAMPIVINLRAQISGLSSAFSLAQQTIEDQGKIIVNLNLKVANLEGVVTEWQAKFNRGESLRLASESLNLSYKKRLSGMRLTGTVEKIVIGGLAAGLVYSMVSK